MAAPATPPLVVEQHYVTFYSPGTFVAEQARSEVAAWDTGAASRMALEIKERHGAVPYGFQFTTRGRAEGDLDAHEVARSCFYWLGGKVETLDEVKARATDKDRILIGNMEANGYARVITNSNSWRWTQPLGDTDVILDWPPAASAEEPAAHG